MTTSSTLRMSCFAWRRSASEISQTDEAVAEVLLDLEVGVPGDGGDEIDEWVAFGHACQSTAASRDGADTDGRLKAARRMAGSRASARALGWSGLACARALLRVVDRAALPDDHDLDLARVLELLLDLLGDVAREHDGVRSR